MEDKQEFAEEASPEHIRSRERKILGKVADYDVKAVNTAEFMVNLCELAIQNLISKLVSLVLESYLR